MVSSSCKEALYFRSYLNLSVVSRWSRNEKSGKHCSHTHLWVWVLMCMKSSHILLVRLLCCGRKRHRGFLIKISKLFSTVTRAAVQKKTTNSNSACRVLINLSSPFLEQFARPPFLSHLHTDPSRFYHRLHNPPASGCKERSNTRREL